MSLRPRSIALGVGIGLALTVLITLTVYGFAPDDARCYYEVDRTQPWVPGGCFLYSPPFVLAMGALPGLMSFEVFAFLLRAAELIVLVAVAGPAVGVALFIPAVAIELNAANINLLIVGAVLVGFRYPCAWAFILLAKVTPGIGLLWFVTRREWRHLTMALGATLVFAVGSWVVAPDLWPKYVGYLFSVPDTSPWTIAWRLPIAAALTVWGARGDHRWAVMVAVFLAMPRWYYLSPVLLVGLFPLVRLARPLRWPQAIGWRRPQTVRATSDGRPVRSVS
jgi:Glycosyltransferase family 87